MAATPPDGIPPCPLCGQSGASRVGTTMGAFLRCEQCALLFRDPVAWLPLDAETRRYEQHENHAGDAGYVAHLRRLADPVIAATAPGARGLDYGCGPTPVLGELLTAAGRPTASFDPHFRNDERLLDGRYDFISCSEVLEHVHDPRPLLRRLRGMLEDGGVLGVMTGLRDDVPDLARWWYLRDPTHVCFYSRETFGWIARNTGWRAPLFPSRDVVLLHPGAG